MAKSRQGILPLGRDYLHTDKGSALSEEGSRRVCSMVALPKWIIAVAK